MGIQALEPTRSGSESSSVTAQPCGGGGGCECGSLGGGTRSSMGGGEWGRDGLVKHSVGGSRRQPLAVSIQKGLLWLSGSGAQLQLLSYAPFSP